MGGDKMTFTHTPGVGVVWDSEVFLETWVTLPTTH